MDNQNARRCFYKGQNVKAEQLNKLQDYSDRGQANLIASLLGYGVVNGFEISIIEGHIVGVTAGLAFNLAGERLILAEGQQVNLAQYIPNVGEKTIKLGIIQDFIKTDPATDSMGNAEYTKWVPSVQFVLGESLDTGVFLLAEIKINPVSIVEIKATSANFTTLQKQIQNTFAFSTDRSSESIVANIDADIFNINNKSFADTIRDITYPINTTYTQSPNKTTGLFDETETPQALFGGDWELVDTKLFNNVPKKESNSLGYWEVYPNRTMVYRICGEIKTNIIDVIVESKVTLPIPFIDTKYSIEVPTIIDTYGSNRPVNTRINNITVTLKKTTFFNIGVQANNTDGNPAQPYCIATGYWKNPTDPISEDEEKNYVKIWKRIAPPIA